MANRSKSTPETAEARATETSDAPAHEAAEAAPEEERTPVAEGEPTPYALDSTHADDRKEHEVGDLEAVVPRPNRDAPILPTNEPGLPVNPNVRVTTEGDVVVDSDLPDVGEDA